MSEPTLIGLAEAAQKSGINKHTLYKGVQRKTYPHHRVGARVMFSQSDLDAIVAMTAVKPAPATERRRAS